MIDFLDDIASDFSRQRHVEAKFALFLLFRKKSLGPVVMMTFQTVYARHDDLLSLPIFYEFEI